jgi:RND family efflux transporter MFP subunit
MPERFATAWDALRIPMSQPSHGAARRAAAAWLLAACCLALGEGGAWGQTEGTPPASVRVARVLQYEFASTEGFVATVRPLRRSVVGSAVDGRVVEFSVKSGQRVQRGEPLARLLTETIAIELEGARAELELRREELAELQATRPERIREAEARLEAARATADHAEANFQRIARLFADARSAVTQEQYELARSEHLRSRQVLLEAEAALRRLKAEREIEKAQARVRVQEETVRGIEDRLSKHTIKAPFDGYVITEHTEVGAWLSRGDLVAEVVDLQQVELDVFVTQEQVAQVRPGTTAAVQIAGLDGPAIPGTVVRVVPQADVRARTFPVVVRLDNLDEGNGPRIKAGMLARVALNIGEPRPTLVVHKDALVLGSGQPLVYVIDAEQTRPVADGQMQSVVRAVAVYTGLSDGAQIQVRPSGPLAAGDLVVVQGNERLRPGAAVVYPAPVDQAQR